MILTNLEGHIRICERGPFLFNNIKFFMKFWKEKYNLEKSDFFATQL